MRNITCPICNGIKDRRAISCVKCRSTHRPARQGTGANPLGWAVTKRGYIARRENSKMVYQHRAVIECAIDRKLLIDEHVHHFNGITTDNRIENLAVLNKSDHHRLHLTSERAKQMSAMALKVRWGNNASNA